MPLPREISLFSSLTSRLFTRSLSFTARSSTASLALSTAELSESETLKPEGLEHLLSDLERLSLRLTRKLPRKSDLLIHFFLHHEGTSQKRVFVLARCI